MSAVHLVQEPNFQFSYLNGKIEIVKVFAETVNIFNNQVKFSKVFLLGQIYTEYLVEPFTKIKK